MNLSVVIPTLNAAGESAKIIKALRNQTVPDFRLHIIDSSSDDNTAEIFRAAGAKVSVLPRRSFNHGASRQLAVEMSPEADIIIFMTQDAILANPDSLKNLLACFDDMKVGIAYGRQLPSMDASPIAAHARLFNYPSDSSIKTLSDCPRSGIKTAFVSNSFAAYRRSTLLAVGGFPSDVILGEDTYVAAKMILSGWKIAYCADATVYHSHNYTFIEEFRRYFDTGVFHSREKWFLESLGKAEGEGKRFVVSEIKYLLENEPWDIPPALVRTFFKYLGYKLGQSERKIHNSIKKKLSMNKGFWRH